MTKLLRLLAAGAAFAASVAVSTTSAVALPNECTVNANAFCSEFGPLGSAAFLECREWYYATQPECQFPPECGPAVCAGVKVEDIQGVV